mmetsp:Transcript_24754/g.17449  ORF Transcript_24754/g.17449 Transcript_24754/m.17449 type:complete len:81 (+) Transcript_24754:571-813(+)
MLERVKAGKKCAILDITSNLGLKNIPASSVYGASKAFHISLSRSMNNLYAKEGIDVLTVTPSAVSTKQNTKDLPVTINCK